MRLGGSTWVSGLLLLALACSADEAADGGRARGTGPVPTGAGAGGGAAPLDLGGGPQPVNAPQGGAPPQVFVPETSTAFERDDTAGSGLDPAVIEQLRGGGPCTHRLLYPYDGTMFPGGLVSPPFMWEGAADAAHLQVSYDGITTVDYELAVGAMSPGELRMPQDAWNEITRRTQNTPLRVRLSVLVGGTVSSCETTLRIAPGNMTGAVYYNTYAAPGAAAPGNGAVMRLTLGQAMSEIYLQWLGPVSWTPGTGPCTSCHSVSFDGSTLVASSHSYDLASKWFDVWSYPLTQTPQPDPIVEQDNAPFGALTPDGTRMLAMGNPDCTAGAETFPRAPNNMPLVEGPEVARVMDVATGEVLAASGLDASWYMWTPQFSPDGTRVVFNHAKPDGAGGTDRRELAVMDYDYASNSFSNLRVIVSRLGPEPTLPYAPAPAGAGAVPTGNDGCTDGPASGGGALSPIPGIPTGAIPGVGGGAATGSLDPGTCEAPCYPVWPFFTPDGNGVVFQLINEPDGTSAFPGRDVAAQGELWYVDLDTLESVRLDNANVGLDPLDAIFNYYPTVLPVQVGGYFWVFWTSRRAFGHRVTDPFGALVGGGIPTASSLEANKKRIWVSALRPKVTGGELRADTPLTDPSFPGFYLEGQSDSGNVRAFATLNPCVPAGTECTSGLDCCTGFCRIEPGAPVGTCSEDVPECAMTNERCQSDDDCCPPESPDAPQNQCIAGFCGFILVE